MGSRTGLRNGRNADAAPGKTMKDLPTTTLPLEHRLRDSFEMR
jgi:hypothetical protein